jgi:WD40 repeat protein
MKIINIGEIQLQSSPLCCKISTKENFIVVGTKDRKVNLIEIVKDNQGRIVSFELKKECEIKTGGFVRCCDTDFNDEFLVFGGGDKKIRLVKIEKSESGSILNAKIVKELKLEEEKGIYCCKISPKFNFLAIGTKSGALKLIKIKRKDEEFEFEPIEKAQINIGKKILSLNISQDENFLIFGGGNYRAKLVKIEKDEKGNIIEMKSFPQAEIEFGGWVNSCYLSEDSNFAIVSSLKDQKIRAFKIEKEKNVKMELLQEIDLEDKTFYCEVNFNKNLILVATKGGSILFFEIKREKDTLEILPMENSKTNLESEISCVSLSETCKFFVIGDGKENKIKFFQIVEKT